MRLIAFPQWDKLSSLLRGVQKAVIDFLLLFMMFSISRVSDHKNAAFAKDLHTDGSA